VAPELLDRAAASIGATAASTVDLTVE